MRLSDILDREWVPALGCTEPASIALAAAHAASVVDGPLRSVHVVCDPRLYKNCYAVGIPHSGGKAGILWALALGAALRDAQAGLECFRGITEGVEAEAQRLLDAGNVTVDVDSDRTDLYADCRVVCGGGVGRAVIADDHTNLIRLEREGDPVDLPAGAGSGSDLGAFRRRLVATPMSELVRIAEAATDDDRKRLLEGAEQNLAVARHGLTMLSVPLDRLGGSELQARISHLVRAGVHARMSGEDLVVMSLAGSGNKGITASVPLLVWGREMGYADDVVARALALSCVVTAATTPRLGRLSAVCGVSNAAGIGIATGLTHLQGGTLDDMDRAVTNLVGNVAGMICDGAKIGCGLKAMTAVDSAFRSASLALAGVGIPASDGIVGATAGESLAALERIAGPGMQAMDTEILRIMQDKLV